MLIRTFITMSMSNPECNPRERRDGRDERDGRNEAGAAAQTREPRERWRVREPDGQPRHEICRDHNGQRGCLCNNCRYEHACGDCEQKEHAKGERQCRGPRK